jgi:hypothetical protein
VFDSAHKAVHYPDDRRFYIRIAPRALAVLLILIFIPLCAAWIERAAAVRLITLDQLPPRQHYTKSQISPYFWANGNMP